MPGVARVEQQLDELRGANNLSARFLHALERLDADVARGVELGQIDLNGRMCGADSDQVRYLRIREASRHPHDIEACLIFDVDPALHKGSLRPCIATDLPFRTAHKSPRAC